MLLKANDAGLKKSLSYASTLL